MVAEQIHQRLLRDPLVDQLGALAADLARIASFSKNPANRHAVASLLEEGKYFAEWIALAAPLEAQVTLAEIQMSLAIWERGWLQHSPVSTMRFEAEHRSEELLELIGLYNLLEVAEGLGKQLAPISRGLEGVLKRIKKAVADRQVEDLRDHLAPLRVGDIFQPHAKTLSFEEPCPYSNNWPHDLVVQSENATIVNEVKRIHDDKKGGPKELIDLVRGAGPQLCKNAKNILWVETLDNKNFDRRNVGDTAWFECGGHLLRPDDQRDLTYAKLDDLSGLGWIHDTSMTTARPTVYLMLEDPQLQSVLETCGVVVKKMEVGAH